MKLNYVYKFFTVTLLGALVACSDSTSAPDAPKVLQGPVLQGVVNGGGGKGALCKESDRETLEVLDLYEGRKLYKLNIPEVSKTDDDLAAFVAEVYFNHFLLGDKDSAGIETFRDKVVAPFIDEISFTENNEVLNQTNDSHEPVMDKNCGVVQIAIYYDESVLIIDSNLWKKMNFINKAALILHEIVYLKARQRGEVNSIKTRKLVGHLLSDKEIAPLKVFDLNAESTVCFLTDENTGVFSGTVPAIIARNATIDGLPGLEIKLGDPLFGDFLMFQRKGFISHMIASDLTSGKDTVVHKNQFDVYEETYSQPQYIANLILGVEEREVSLDLKELKSNSEKSFKLKCLRNEDMFEQQVEKDIEGEDFLAKFYAIYGGGSFTEKDHGEVFVFQEEGKMKRVRFRQVGSDETPEIPYPTVCRYQGDFKVNYIIKRDDESRQRYLSYATHVMEIEQTGISLLDNDENTEHCEAYIDREKKSIEEVGIIHAIYLETIDDNSFRTHTSGGGGYKFGVPRGDFGTLDEVYVRD